MTKLYNTQTEITNKFREFLKKYIPSLRKTQLNIIPEIIFGMISSESVVSSDIAKCLKNEFSFIQLESIQRRIRRFFNNDLFDSEVFFNALITYVISKYSKKHKDKRIHITFDHMFSHDNYVTLMFIMRVGKQGIPIWFKSFKQEYINKKVSLEKGGTIAFNEALIIEGIKHVSTLFNKSFDLIFLADRWFNSEKILSTIASLGHTYCIRLKKNIPKPIKTEIIELILCFTISVSLLAFNLGYFKLASNPITADKNIVLNVSVIICIKYAKLTPTLIINSISEIKKNGNSII